MPDSGRNSHSNFPERSMEQRDMGASRQNTGGGWRAEERATGSPSTVPPELRSLMARAGAASGDNNSVEGQQTSTSKDSSPLSDIPDIEQQRTPPSREATEEYESSSEPAPESVHSDYKPKSVRSKFVRSESVHSGVSGDQEIIESSTTKFLSRRRRGEGDTTSSDEDQQSIAEGPSHRRRKARKIIEDSDDE